MRAMNEWCRPAAGVYTDGGEARPSRARIGEGTL